jgi:hypothetical protein
LLAAVVVVPLAAVVAAQVDIARLLVAQLLVARPQQITQSQSAVVVLVPALHKATELAEAILSLMLLHRSVVAAVVVQYLLIISQA